MFEFSSSFSLHFATPISFLPLEFMFLLSDDWNCHLGGDPFTIGGVLYHRGLYQSHRVHHDYSATIGFAAPYAHWGSFFSWSCYCSWPHGYILALDSFEVSSIVNIYFFFFFYGLPDCGFSREVLLVQVWEIHNYKPNSVYGINSLW